MRGLRGVGLPAKVGGAEAGARVDFLALPSGRLGGRVEGVFKEEPGIDFYRFPVLRRIDPRTKRGEELYFRQAERELVPAAEGSTRDMSFDFYQVPAGKYVIEVQVQGPLPLRFYYPGAESVSEAEVIDFPEASRLDGLRVKLPPLIYGGVSGRVTLPDGRPVAAMVRLVDAAQPSAVGEKFANASGEFGFRFFRGRRFHLYAPFDGEQDGRPVRYSGQALDNWDGPVDPDAWAGTFGPVKLVLDRVEPR